MLSLPFTSERSIEIMRPASEVLPWLSDLNNWKAWSPWLRLEPGSKLEIMGQPAQAEHRQRWEGEFIGTGEMVLKSCSSHRLDYELLFLKPWKSQSQASFTLEERAGGTKVTWSMKGSVPIFLFFLRRMMASYIGSDFNRGLLMLKEMVEKGHVASQLDFKDIVSQKGFHYVGRTRSCKISELSKFMSEDFQYLWGLITAGTLPKPDFGFSFTYKWDIVNGETRYLAGLAYSKPMQPKAELSLQTGAVADHKAFRVDHIGAYRFLGNGWSALMSRQRKLKLKALKSISMYEVYRTTPDRTPENDLVTELYLPLQN